MRAAARLLGVARDLDPQRREPERPPQHALDHAHGVHAPHRHRRLACAASSPRRIRSRSPSRATVKPANATSEPATESRPRRPAAAPPTASSQPPTRVGHEPRRLLDAPLVLPNTLREAAGTRPPATGRITPSWPAVSAAISPSRRLSRRSGRSPAGASSTTSGRRPRTASRSRSTASGADRVEHDLALGAAARRLHVHRHDAEQPLDRPGHGVEALDAARAAPSSASCARSRSASARRARRPRSSCCASA